MSPRPSFIDAPTLRPTRLRPCCTRLRPCSDPAADPAPTPLAAAGAVAGAGRGLHPRSYPSVTSRHAADPRCHPVRRVHRRHRRPAHPRELSGRARVGRGAGDVGRRSLQGEGSAQELARRRRADPRARARRGLPRGDGEQHQLQHRVDEHLRADQHLRCVEAPRPRERVGQASRPAIPRGRQRRVGCGAQGRLGRAQLEAGRPRHGALQSRRRPGPFGSRRLDDGREPAHLGLRDQLRGPRRSRRGEGQCADAEARPPDVGGGGGQRAVQLDQLPHARRQARRPHEAGRRRAHLGRDRWHRCLRGAVRAERWRHPGVRRQLGRQGADPAQHGCRAHHRPRRRGLPVLEGRAHPRRGRVAPPGQGHPRAVR